MGFAPFFSPLLLSAHLTLYSTTRGQVVTDPSGKPTTGNITKYTAQPFATTSTTGSVGANGDVNVTVSATRSVHIESKIVSGSGHVNNVVFTQNLEFTNVQNYLDNTLIQVWNCAVVEMLMSRMPRSDDTDNESVQNVFQEASGSVLSTHNGIPALVDNFQFPFIINFTILKPDGSQCKSAPSMSLTMKANQPCNKSRHSLTTPMIVQSFPLPSCLAPRSRSTSLQEASSRLHLRVTQAMALRTTHSPMSIPLVTPSTGRSMRR